MFMRAILPFVVFAFLFVYERRGWKRRSGRERAVYGFLLLAALYLSLIYVLELPWPNLNDLFGFLFAGPSKSILQFFK